MARYYQDYDIPMLWDIKFDKVIRKWSWFTIIEFWLILFCIFLWFWYYFNTTVTMYWKIVPIVWLWYTLVWFLSSHWNDLKNYQHLILFFNYFLFSPKVYEPVIPKSLREFNKWKIYWEKILIELTKEDFNWNWINKDTEKEKIRIWTKI